MTIEVNVFFTCNIIEVAMPRRRRVFRQPFIQPSPIRQLSNVRTAAKMRRPRSKGRLITPPTKRGILLRHN